MELPAAPRNPVAVALYDYDAVEEGELNFAEGAQIEILLKDDSGWWKGKVGEDVGWFPAEYIKEVPQQQSPRSADPPPALPALPSQARMQSQIVTPGGPTSAPVPAPVTSRPPAPVAIRASMQIDQDAVNEKMATSCFSSADVVTII